MSLLCYCALHVCLLTSDLRLSLLLLCSSPSLRPPLLSPPLSPEISLIIYLFCLLFSPLVHFLSFPFMSPILHFLSTPLSFLFLSFTCLLLPHLISFSPHICFSSMFLLFLSSSPCLLHFSSSSPHLSFPPHIFSSPLHVSYPLFFPKP